MLVERVNTRPGDLGFREEDLDKKGKNFLSVVKLRSGETWRF